MEKGKRGGEAGRDAHDGTMQWQGDRRSGAGEGTRRAGRRGQGDMNKISLTLKEETGFKNKPILANDAG